MVPPIWTWNWPLPYPSPVNVTGPSGLTRMLKLVLALNGGVALSATLTTTLLVVLASATGGRHEYIPLTGPMLPGPLPRLNVSTRLGTASVAVAVNDTVCPGLTVKFEI